MHTSIANLRAATTLGLALVAALATAQVTYPTPYYFTTFAGASAHGAIDGPGATARFYHPAGIAIDTDGNAYVTDPGNNTIRKITPAGIVTTLAGVPGTVGNSDGRGAAARFNTPWAITTDLAGNLFVHDTGNNAIRKVTLQGEVTTVVAPTDRETTEVDLLIAAQRAPTSLAAVDIPMKRNGWYFEWEYIDKGYYSDFRVSPFYLSPPTLAFDSAGNVYSANDAAIYKTTSGGIVSLLAGEPRSYGPVDGLGSAARFGHSLSLATDLSGQVYVADQACYVIRKVGPAGDVVTVAGVGYVQNVEGRPVAIDGGPANSSFVSLSAIAATASGGLLVADETTIRSVAPDGSVVTLAGLSPSNAIGHADGAGTAARFGNDLRCTLAPDGCLYVADYLTIRKITPDGIVSTFAGRYGAWGSTDGTGDSALFGRAANLGIAADRHGNLYVADSGNHTIRKITPAGVVTTLAGQPGVSGTTDGPAATATFFYPEEIAVDGAGNVFVLSFAPPGATVLRLITPEGNVSTIHNDVIGPLVGDSAGNVYGVIGTTIAKLHPDGSTTAVLDVSTTWPNLRPRSGQAGASVGPFAVAPNGDIYHTKPDGLVRRISAGGSVATLAGKWLHGADLPWVPDIPADGLGEAARFVNPASIAVDSAGTVYLCDGSTIRKGVPTGPVAITAQPQSQSTTPGTSVQFSVTATAMPAPTYQWQRDGTPISGATAATYSIASVSNTDAGNYSVVVTNDLGSVTSNLATLTVSAAPVTPTTPSKPSSGGGGGAVGLGLALTSLLLAALRMRTLRAHRSPLH